jgi:TolB protein
MLLVVAACGGSTPTASTASSAIDRPTARPTSTRAPSPAVATPSPAIVDSPVTSSGSIAVLGRDGSLSVVDPAGRAVLLSDAAEGVFGFPAWSPDGSQVAAVRSSDSAMVILVFNAGDVMSGARVKPIVIFRSNRVAPFYLFWTPDGRDVSFLASQSGELSLRIAPADGSAPVDGSGPGAIIRTGHPFYYDWIGGDRLLAHIGNGPDAFLGEILLNGDAAGPAIGGPGDFHSAVANRDGSSIAFVRAGQVGRGHVVVSARDGSDEHALLVFGTAAVVFDPTGGTIASIGPVRPQAPAGFPIGPVRLIDTKSGDVRTLIDGFVVGFWWSPDGKTMAALRVQPKVSSGQSSPLPLDERPAREFRLLFVDVATGQVRSQPVVHPGDLFVEGLMANFDQYALSHHVWSPDSSSFLLSEVGPDGTTQISIRYPDGEQPVTIDGEIGFWSP